MLTDPLSVCLATFKNSFEPYRQTGVEMTPKAIAAVLDVLGTYARYAAKMEQGLLHLHDLHSSARAIHAEADALEKFISDLNWPDEPPHAPEPDHEADNHLMQSIASGKVLLHPRLLYVDQTETGGSAA